VKITKKLEVFFFGRGKEDGVDLSCTQLKWRALVALTQRVLKMAGTTADTVRKKMLGVGETSRHANLRLDRGGGSEWRKGRGSYIVRGKTSPGERMDRKDGKRLRGGCGQRYSGNRHHLSALKEIASAQGRATKRQGCGGRMEKHQEKNKYLFT